MALTDWPAVGKLRASVLRALIEERVPAVAMRTSDGTPVNNSTTLVADTVLTLPVVASATYTLDGLLVTNSGTTPDIKIGCTYPSGTTGVWSLLAGPVTNTTAATSVDMGSAGLNTAHSRNGIAANAVMVVMGCVWTSSADGSFTITMAQATANASDTKLIAGSWIRLQRVS